MESHDEHGLERPPMNSPRRWMRRAMLSVLAGGGLTAAGLGGPVVGVLPSADAAAASGGGGPAEDTVTSTSASTPAPSAPEQGTTSETTSTTTATTTAPPSTSSTSPAPTPAPESPAAPAAAPAPSPAAAPSVPNAPSGSSAPTVVVQRKQLPPPKRRGSKTGKEDASAKSPGGAESKGAHSPATVPPGTPNNVAPAPQVVAAQAGTLASVLGQSAVSAQALEFYRVPLFLLPIYQAAGIQYGVPWQVLAAINEVETDYGTNVSVSSAGAVGWMQFMPETWLQYGVDALGAGYADPYNPVDAIFAAARYLHAAGASSNLHTAILAYNHSDAYVESVLLRAKLIASYPQSVIATLTGLTEGRLPVAGARIAADPNTSALALSPSNATAGAVAVEGAPATGSGEAAPGAPRMGAQAGSTAGAQPSGAATTIPGASDAPAPAAAASGLNTSPSAASAAVGSAAAARAGRGKKAEDLRFIDLLGAPEEAVTAAEDGRIVKLGRSHKLGNYLALRDIYGDVFTYAGLGSIAPRYHVLATPANPRLPAAAVAAGGKRSAAKTAKVAGAHDPKPTLPASAGSHPLTLHVKASGGHAAEEAEEQSLSGAGVVPAGMGRVRLYAHPSNPVARVAAVRAAARNGQSDGHGGRWLPLRLGSIVSQGTVLGHLKGVPGKAPVQSAAPPQGAANLNVPLGSRALGTLAVGAAARSARLRFAIRPAGDTATIDAGPILQNWRQLDVALHPKGAKGALDLLGATAAQVFLMSQSELERTVLSDPGIEIYACGRQDIASGAIDGRVLATLEFLSRSGLRPTVSALRCGHGEFTTSGNVSEHYFGDAVDIAAINGIPIAGHQGPGSITDVTIRALLTLQGRFVPHQIISLMKYPEASNTLALPDHWNHIHVGFRPVGGAMPATAATAAHSAGKAGQPAPSPLAVAPELSASQWNRLIARIGTLQQPTVSAKPSSAAIRDPQAAPTNRDLGSRALPSPSSSSEGSGVEE